MKLGQCLDMDDITSLREFVEFTLPTSDFRGCSVSYRLAFSAFYRLFCKIVNLWDIDMKFSENIYDVDMNNPA